MRIAPSLDVLPRIDYRKVQDFQGELKTLSEANFERLRSLLLGTDTEPAQGFVYPLYVWTDAKGKHWCIDGHQRLQVLRRLNVQPYELPYVPVEANSVKQAKQRLLALNSQYGEISHKGFIEFVGKDIPTDWLRTYTTLESYAMPKVEFSFGTGAGLGAQQGQGEPASAHYEPAQNNYDDGDEYMQQYQDESLENERTDFSARVKVRYRIEVELDTENEQEKLFTQLQKEGYKCKVSIF